MPISIEAPNEASLAAGGDLATDGFVEVELELALDMQDPTQNRFDECVRSAAVVVGGELLFDMPADGAIDDASRIAAIRVPGLRTDIILFAILNADEASIEVRGREEVGERFFGFARAFVGVLTRIRDDMRFASMSAEGSA